MNMNARNFLFCTAVLLASFLAACGKSDPSALITSAKAYLAKSDVKSGVIQLKTALQQAPDNAEARFLLGKVLLEAGDPVAAETEIRKALDLKYPRDEAYPLLAWALVNQGEFKKVTAEFRDPKVESNSAKASLATSLAIAYLALADLKNAGASVDAALAAQ